MEGYTKYRPLSYAQNDRVMVTTGRHRGVLGTIINVGRGGWYTVGVGPVEVKLQAYDLAPATFTSAKQKLAAIGVVLTKKDGEFRVRRKGASPDADYFTNDLTDAVLTACRIG